VGNKITESSWDNRTSITPSFSGEVSEGSWELSLSLSGSETVSESITSDIPYKTIQLYFYEPVARDSSSIDDNDDDSEDSQRLIITER